MFYTHWWYITFDLGFQLPLWNAMDYISIYTYILRQVFPWQKIISAFDCTSYPNLFSIGKRSVTWLNYIWFYSLNLALRSQWSQFVMKTQSSVRKSSDNELNCMQHRLVLRAILSIHHPVWRQTIPSRLQSSVLCKDCRHKNLTWEVCVTASRRCSKVITMFKDGTRANYSDLLWVLRFNATSDFGNWPRFSQCSGP